MQKFFILGREKLSECIGTTHDAERLKRNLSYAIRGNCDKTIDDLTTAVKSVLEHHFNNHEFCGDWCQCKGKTEEELKDLKLKYRDKSIHAKFYAQLQPIFQKCLDKIADVHHTYNSNINEGFNKLICKFVPKDRNFNGTKEYETRINIAVCIDSVGYLETYVDLFNELDMKLCYNLVQKLHSMDTRKKYKRKYQQKIELKRKRIQTFHDKLRKGELQLRTARKKEEMYFSGMNYHGTAEAEIDTLQVSNSTGEKKSKKNKQNGKKNDTPCKSCGLYNHRRKSSLKCLLNKKTRIMPVSKKKNCRSVNSKNYPVHNKFYTTNSPALFLPYYQSYKYFEYIFSSLRKNR